MDDPIQVNFHSHSIFSDGELTPETLAGNLAAAGVRYAALTDHDTLEGLPRFQEALRKRGIAFLTGVELTTRLNGREVHLLGYGFNPRHPELAVTLHSLRQVRDAQVHNLNGTMHRVGNSHAGHAAASPAVSAAPNGYLETGAAIDLLHRAGGHAFLAHPLLLEPDVTRLDALVVELKNLGLDGIEAYYAPFSDSEQASLRELAQKYGLLVCAGTDTHGRNGTGSHAFAVSMPRQDWNAFRQAVFSGAGFHQDPADPPQSTVIPPTGQVRPHRIRRRSFALRIFLPTLIAIGLFLAAFWGALLPSFERTLLDRKRELIRELTNSAWTILASYHAEEQSGALSREQAQAQAIRRVEALRYGAENKDYFWIQDTRPVMIMHPYRPDLNGQDLRSFTDPRGVRIFVEFAALVQREGDGYIDYVWQWFDDPNRLEPKESYVKGFQPWGWIIGTGVYLDDVQQEIARIEQSLIHTSLAISGAIVLLLLFVLQQSLRIERERQEVLDSLRESTERYQSLIEATTEGTLLVLDGRLRYANPTFLAMLGTTTRQLEFLELIDLLPRRAENRAIWERLDEMPGESSASGDALEGSLQRLDGSLVECILALNPIQIAGQQGFILLAKDIARNPSALGGDGLQQAAQSVALGIFRARAARRGVLLEINPQGRTFLAWLSPADSSQPALADFFSDPAEYDQVFQILLAEGEVRSHVLHIETPDARARFISLSARLIRDERQQPAFIDGTLEDVTAARSQEAGREALIEKLQASLLFLHEPVANLARDVITCPMESSIEQLARQMTTRKLTAALVVSERQTVIGIVTDHDLRSRVLAGKSRLDAPVHTIMSAPLIKIADQASIYEALLRMEEEGVRHLAVEDQTGQIVNVIDNKALVQFHRYGPIVLSREISRARTPDEVAVSCGRTAPLVKTLMDASARPRLVTNMLTSICDAATERLIQLAIDDLGPPPAPFAFIGMGSQGRQELTLLTDQDNGILFAPGGQVDPQTKRDYFLRLGAMVCDNLRLAGYHHCRGGVMANNPRWCRSLPDWLAGFDQWVIKAEPQEIMESSIFFDFRTLVGDTGLTNELRQHVHATLQEVPAFFHHYAQNALIFKPPFRLVGNIYLRGGSTDHAGEINLKDAMMPIVSFARLYALRHRLNQTNTLERIEALADHNIIHTSSRDEIITAYDFLMQLRLQSQLAAIQAGRQPTNTIQPSRLGSMQQEMLKHAFAQIAAVQKKVTFDFPGGG